MFCLQSWIITIWLDNKDLREIFYYSNYRLKQTCELQISNLIEEDFGRAVKCVVNDSGQVSILQAFPFKKG